jgi:hypothetical protein
VIPDHPGAVCYLNGVIRDVDGSWIVTCSDLAALDNVAECLPAMYLHLLTPESDDWQMLGGSKEIDGCTRSDYT